MYDKPVLSIQECQAAVVAMLEESKKHPEPIAFAIVDAEGNLISYARTDGAALRSQQNCIKKAYTAAISQSDTSAAFIERMKDRGVGLGDLGNPNYIALTGGIVVRHPKSGQVIGGIGVDMVDVARLRLALHRTSGFAEMVFTAEERRATDGRRGRARRLAAVFAAKEAFLKAVGLGLWRGVPLHEIEVVESNTDRVRFRLGPLAKKVLHDRGCASASLSLSHERNTAMAVVMVH